jgi:cobalt/nickel transport system ATP-binding protein
VIEQMTLDVAAGERVALAGPNGAGKTTLLLALVGAVPFSGRIAIGERALERATLAELRREIGVTARAPPRRSVSENSGAWRSQARSRVRRGCF